MPMIASVAGVFLALILGGQHPHVPLEILGKLDARDLPEASGIVKSRRFEGIYWIHNDSGNPPFLFAIRRDGKIVRRYKVDAPNIDWEDIAIDDAGHLYLGDIGNNGGHLPIRAVYQIDEPDPSLPVAGPLKALKIWNYTFPQSGRFDAEGLVIDRGRAVLVGKSLDRREAEIYTLPLDRPATLFRPTVPSNVGALPGFREPATGAALSADGAWLAVCSDTSTRVYTRAKPGKDANTAEADGPWTLFAEVKYPPCNIEAVCWDGRNLVLASEDDLLFGLSESIWKGAAVSKSRAATEAHPGRLAIETQE